MRTFNKLTILLFFICSAFAAHAQQVEPTFWWVGMKNPNLQVMVHDKDIKGADVELQKEDGVAITAVNTADSPNYLFVDLFVSENAPAQEFKIVLKKEGKKIASYNYELKKRERKAEELVGFDASDVIYLITPDRFANGDYSNDSNKDLFEKADRNAWGGRHGGDMQGVMDHMDYFKDMGFTAIWLNPLLENNMEDYSYHGYSTTDYYKADTRYGSNEEYKAMVDMARENHIKVIMDVIVNHCGSNHWWMKDLPFNDWINNGGEFMQTSHVHHVAQDVHASDYDRQMFNDGWFASVMPDLNQRNPYLSKYLIQNNIWWIEYLGLSGLRQDTYSYSDPQFMTDWSCAIMEEYPNLNIVGEEWVNQPAMIAYWQKGNNNKDGYTSCLPSLMDFPLQESLVKSLTSDPNNEDGWGSKFKILYETLTQDYLYPDPENLVIFPDNHDMSRFYTQVGRDLDLYKMGIAFIMTSRGIPQIYYGTEILANDSTGDHGEIRSDFPGGWKEDAVNVFTNKGLSKDQAEALAYVKTLSNWRKDCQVVHHGKLMHFVPENSNLVYSYIRYNDKGERVFVVLNRDNKDYELSMDKYKEILPAEFKAKDVINGGTINVDGSLKIPAKQALILELIK